MTQQEIWNNKFSKHDFLYGKKPNLFIASQSKKFEKNSKVLCIGEGEGRNAIFLAKRGFKVSAVDASNIGLEKLEKRAKDEQLEIKTYCEDLSHFEIDEKFDIIVATYFHIPLEQRETLFFKIESMLKDSGIFVGEFFSTKQLAYSSGGPKDENLLYTKDEFTKYFTLCEKEVKQVVTILDEGRGHQGEADVIRVFIKK
ncbi:MAG: class I SAM-dependent methyltransferase [Campylobacterota bacterium]